MVRKKRSYPISSHIPFVGGSKESKGFGFKDTTPSEPIKISPEKLRKMVSLIQRGLVP